MLETFKKHIDKQALFGKDSKMLATVSGGVDSVVLCYLLKHGGYDFSIAHCNFGLRGEESDNDEQFVKSLANTLGVPIYAQNFVITNDTGKSIQMQARDLRYEWFRALRNEHGFDYVLTAHHKNDNVETVLLNLIRGTGHKGLTGISEKHDFLVRPLLPFSKYELLEYAHKHNLEWRDDSSNEKDDYKRNYIRHHIIPELEKLNPSLLDTFEQNIMRFQEESNIILSVLGKADMPTLSIAEVKAHVSPLMMIWHWIQPMDFSFSDAKDMLEGLDDISGKQYHASEFTITKDREYFFREENKDRKIPEFDIEGVGSGSAGTYYYVVSEVDASEARFEEGNNIAYLDKSALRFPLKVRTWQEGDRFRPLGMKGEKKVSDFFIDEKIPVHLKSKQLLLISEDKIAWIVHHRLDDRFKITDTTTKVMRIQIEENA